jgi:ferritin-like metal-binding protein YciE
MPSSIPQRAPTIGLRLVPAAPEVWSDPSGRAMTKHPTMLAQAHRNAAEHLFTLSDKDFIMADKTLDDLFHDTLRDIFYAEKKILKGLTKMARAAQLPELKAAFEKHYDETEGQVERLEKVFDIIGKRARGKTCPAIDGILEEGDEIASDYKGTSALDAGLVSAAQAVEHYEIARYGTLRRWAQMLGLTDAVSLLEATLAEESATDEALSALAEQMANEKAADAAA